MLVLGSKYKFTELELNMLNKKFKKITHIKYADKSEEEAIQSIKECVDRENFEVIVLNTRAKVGDDIIRYLTRLQFKKRNKKIKIIAIENFMEEYLKKCYIPESHEDLKFLSDIKPYNSFEYLLKRSIDHTAVFILSIVHFFIKFYIEKKIKEQSPGRLYFSQNRVGLNMKSFNCYKFRSMHENSYHNPYTQENDERIFKFGNFMRKTRIDEIPQYINILKGDMHLIGPRAEWNILVKNYEKEIPYYNERHIVRPGITGWAQVMYPYGSNIEDAKQKLMYDLYYIKNWSIWLEIKIIWKTIMVIIKQEGV